MRIEIIVRPSTREKFYPLTAFLSGTTLEGQGPTVQAAIEDLFTCAEMGKLCAPLELAVREVAR
jgi:hypothetical protein